MATVKDYSPRLGVSYTPGASGQALSTLAHGTDGQLLIAQTAAATAYKTVTGDVTVDKNGVTAIGAGKVLESMIALASVAGLGVLRVAHMKYDFAADGGAQGEIIPASSGLIPAKAIVFGGLIDVTTALLATGGAANISLGTHAGSSATSLKAATPKATYALNALLAMVPVFTAATAFKMSVAGQMSITVDTNDLTAGVLEAFVVYFVAAT